MAVEKEFNRNYFLRMISILALALLFIIGFTTDYITAAEGKKKVTIIHTNDIHGQIDDFAKLAAYKQKEDNDSDIFFYVDAGDIFSGNPVVDMNDGEPIVDLLNQVGLDLIGIGNHEYDYGAEALNKRVAQANFEFLSANTEVQESVFNQPEPFTIKEQDGVKFGFIGLTQAPPATAPKNIVGIEFHSYKETLKQYEYLRDEVDVLIGVNHIGFNEDLKVAEEFDMFDAIIGGHSHTEMKEEKVINETVIVQTGSHLNNIGNMTITLDGDNNVESIDWELQPVKDLTDIDTKIQASIDAYNADMEEELETVIGKTTGLGQDGKYAGDVPLGNFWTDAMSELVGADIAFTNNGGIRASIEQGNVTYGDIYNIEPFSNQIMEIDMTGEAILDVLKYSYTRDERNRIDLQASGLNYTVVTDDKGNYIGLEVTIAGEPLQLNKTYKAAVPDYIGSGGSGYNFVGDVITPNSGLMTRAMIDYAELLMNKDNLIDVQVEDRIKIKSVNLKEISIAEAKELKDGEWATIEGIALTSSDAFEGKSFYIHDGTAGVAVDQTNIDVSEGDHVKLTGSVNTNSKEIQFNFLSSIEVIAKDESLPEPKLTVIGEINETLVGELVLLEKVTIQDLNRTEENGTFEFKSLNEETEFIQIIVGDPSGLAYEDVSNGDLIDVIGIVGKNENGLYIQPRKASDIIKFEEEEKEEPKEPVEPENPDTPGDNGEEDEDSPVDNDKDTDETEDNTNGVVEKATPPAAGNTDTNQEGSALPKTATNTWNVLMIGGALFILGGGLLFMTLRKRKMNHS